MKRSLSIAFVLAAAVHAAGCGSGAPPTPQSAAEPVPDVGAKLRAILGGPQRTEKERARDVHRHPLETLQFLGLRDDMKVVELSAGQGWYTAILGPLLAERGKLSITGGNPNGPPESESVRNAKALAERFAKDPGSFGKVTTLVVDWKQEASPPLGPDESADAVLTFRNLHGWIGAGVMTKVLAASFKVLKHGGVLGVVEHRARPETRADIKLISDTGYVPEAHAVALIEQAGFKLAGKSEINANPKDTKDYAKGVWALPPTLELGEVDRDKYLAIGESDRMTLRFVKP